MGALTTKYMPLTLQIANVFTKALPHFQFTKFHFKLRVHPILLTSLRGTIKFHEGKAIIQSYVYMESKQYANGKEEYQSPMNQTTATHLYEERNHLTVGSNHSVSTREENELATRITDIVPLI